MRTIVSADNRQGGQSSGGQTSGRTFVPDRLISKVSCGVSLERFSPLDSVFSMFFMWYLDKILPNLSNTKKNHQMNLKKVFFLFGRYKVALIFNVDGFCSNFDSSYKSCRLFRIYKYFVHSSIFLLVTELSNFVLNFEL